MTGCVTSTGRDTAADSGNVGGAGDPVPTLHRVDVVDVTAEPNMCPQDPERALRRDLL